MLTRTKNQEQTQERIPSRCELHKTGLPTQYPATVLQIHDT